MWTQWLETTLLAPVPHRQVVRTSPKRLRACCLYRRRLLGEIAGVAARPEEQLRVQQQLHGSAPKSAAIASRPMPSKSLGMRNAPSRNPNRRAAVGASTGPSVATGVPARAMTTVSPASTRARRRERCVLASWMLTVSV